MPKSSAMSFCFKLYDCVNSVETKARMDGTTDFTATSQGMSMCGSPLEAIVLCRNLFKHDECHIIHDVCHRRETNENNPTLTFSPFSSLSSGAVGCQPLTYA